MERVCVTCLKPPIPPNHFRRRAEGMLNRQCNDCRNKYLRNRRAAIRDGTWEPHSKPRTCFAKETTPKATLTPRTVDLYWAAGFLEGEGCFRAADRTEEAYASQVDPEPLYRLQLLFGGRIQLRTNRRPIYEWQVHGARARGVMMTLYSLLSARRRGQIRQALGWSHSEASRS
jgi:hypothetical protein